MVYEEYHDLLKKYKEAENSYYNALDKKSKLLYGIESHASKPKALIVNSSHDPYDDPMINYVAEIKEVDDLINETRNNKDMLEHELKKKELELRASVDVYDRIYVYKWIEHKRVKNYWRLLNYSRAQVYRFIDEIKEKLYPKEKMRQNETKIGV